MNLLQPDRLQALARDYVLGTMQGGARRRFERLLHESAAARHAQAAWQAHFAALAAAVPPLAPRERVWHGLARRLGLQTAAAARPSVWQRWLAPRALGGVLAGAMMTLVAGTLVLQAYPGWIGHETVRDELPASYVGLLSDATGRPALLLSSRRHGRVLTVKLLQPLTPPAGQVAVLWAYARSGGAPFLVGTISAGAGTARLALAEPSEALFFDVERLGVSFEPAGAPPAAPSTEPLLAGPCVKLW